MHKKHGIRALALVLAMVMVLGLIPAAAAAPAQSEAKSFQTIADYLQKQKTTFDRVDPETEVEFIVELDDAPLADSIPAGTKLADYLDTRRGSVQANAIAQQQAVMAAAVEGCADDVTITHRYQVVMNGFAVSGRLSDREKLEALEEIIDSTGEPVLVFYSFRHDLEAIKKRIPDARELESSEDIARWNRGEIPVLLCHPASVGYGLNLQEGGHVIVWYGLTWSLELYQQANARLYRQGQERSVIIHHLITEDTVDEQVMKALKAKDTSQAALLKALKERTKG